VIVVRAEGGPHDLPHSQITNRESRMLDMLRARRSRASIRTSGAPAARSVSMNRTARLAIAGALALVIAAAGGRPIAAQAPQQDVSAVKIVTTKISNNFYALDGNGGRMGFQFGPDGIFVVDTQFAPLTERLVAAIREISPAPLKFVVNTHVHGDHTGGNENFARLGATILSRPQLRERLAKPSAPAGGNAPAPAPAAALPRITYDAKTTVYMNGEAIELIPLNRAHTDGDTAVRFPNADALMTGDVFRSTGFPNIDRTNGGSLRGIVAGLDTIIATAGANTRILPGHGDITTRAAVVAHREMLLKVRDRVAELIKQGKTQEQIVAAKPTADFDQQVGNAAQSADRFVGQLYAELRGSSGVTQ
jgi:glyoxylase-like metal-dependent hydrolase (beta-lactamase superfamily II)